MTPTKFRNVDLNNFLDNETWEKIFECMKEKLSERYGYEVDDISIKLTADADVKWRQK